MNVTVIKIRKSIEEEPCRGYIDGDIVIESLSEYNRHKNQKWNIVTIAEQEGIQVLLRRYCPESKEIQERRSYDGKRNH